jgi:hypothetical protein
MGRWEKIEMKCLVRTYGGIRLSYAPTVFEGRIMRMSIAANDPRYVGAATQDDISALHRRGAIPAVAKQPPYRNVISDVRDYLSLDSIKARCRRYQRKQHTRRRQV